MPKLRWLRALSGCVLVIALFLLGFAAANYYIVERFPHLGVYLR